MICLLLCLGCTPTRNTIAPYDKNPQKAVQLAAQAEQLCRQKRQQLPPHPFTTDGCSMWPDSDWQGCCIQHDMAYWCGGVGKKKADQALRSCVRKSGHSINAAIMYRGVRMGGVSWMPFPWRWGYGWDWLEDPDEKK